jgi:endoglucanase
MKFKKIISAVTAAVMCISMLAGCTKSAVTSDSEVVETVQAEDTAGTFVSAKNDEIDTTMTAIEFTSNIRVGWNLGNTLDATGGVGLTSETSWGNPKTTPELIQLVKDGGFNAVRIPTTWCNHMDDDYNIDSEWMARVTEVVDYAYDEGMYVILNMHHEDWNYPYEDNKEAASEIMTKVWTQIAENFKGYDEHLIFEGMNEPRWVGTSEEWSGGNDEGRSVVNYLDQVFVNTVRATGGNNESRFLMVCPYAASSTESALEALELPDDPANRLIVSVHAYIPYSFALQEKGSDKWLADREGCTRDIDTLADVLDRLFISKGTAVIIGECGAMNRDNEEYRAAWAEYYMSKFKSLGIPCFLWDNGAFLSGETFGLVNRYTNTWQYPDLIDGIMKGAGE